MTARTLVLNGFGQKLGLAGDRLVVKEAQAPAREVPLDDLDAVVVPRRGVAVTSDLVQAAVERGIDLHFLETNGRPFATLLSPCLNATISTRRAQLRALDGPAGLAVALACIDGKLRHQRSLLRYFARSTAREDAARAAEVARLADAVEACRRDLPIEDDTPLELARPTLLGIEGSAGRVYWDAFGQLAGEAWAFSGRRRRGDEPDPLNAALNYGYGILTARVTGAAVRAGLEPYAGFLHVDRPGRPSLVLDLVELFRQPVVDRTVLALARRRTPWTLTDEGFLGAETRKEVAAAVLEALAKDIDVRGRASSVSGLIQDEARRLASALRRGTRWKPHRFRF